MLSILKITTSFGSMCRNLQNDSPLLLTKLRPFLYWRHLVEGLVQAMFNCERRSTEPRIYQLSHVLGVWISYPDTPVTSTMHQTGLEPASHENPLDPGCIRCSYQVPSPVSERQGASMFALHLPANLYTSKSKVQFAAEETLWPAGHGLGFRIYARLWRPDEKRKSEAKTMVD